MVPITRFRIVQEESEKLFEEEYDGDVPKVLVGMKFPEKYRRAEGESEIVN